MRGKPGVVTDFPQKGYDCILASGSCILAGRRKRSRDVQPTDHRAEKYHQYDPSVQGANLLERGEYVGPQL